jgi:hypothetical protein
MDGRRAQLIDPVLRTIPRLQRATTMEPPGTEAPPAPATAPVPAPGWFDRRLADGWAFALGLGWPLAFVVTGALEPAPVDPNAPVPLVVDLGAWAFLVALIATVCAAITRHRLAAPAALVAGGVMTAFTVACPVSGHHTYGLWWVAQLGVTLGMLGVSAAAMGRRATIDRRP